MEGKGEVLRPTAFSATATVDVWCPAENKMYHFSVRFCLHPLNKSTGRAGTLFSKSRLSHLGAVEPWAISLIIPSLFPHL